jgi:hypothetical protein
MLTWWVNRLPVTDTYWSSKRMRVTCELTYRDCVDTFGTNTTCTT